MEFLKEVDQRRAFTLLEGLFRVTDKMLKKSNLNYFAIDCDSTKETINGKQEEVTKGYTHTK